jgi:hypothetical protein
MVMKNAKEKLGQRRSPRATGEQLEGQVLGAETKNAREREKGGRSQTAGCRAAVCWSLASSLKF